MKRLQLLIVSAEKINRDALKKALDGDRFDITIAESDEAAVEGFCQRTYDVVVAGKELNDETMKKLKAVIKKVAEHTILIQQKDNGGMGLKDEISEAYSAKQRENLQHIKVNDTTDAKNMEGLIHFVK